MHPPEPHHKGKWGLSEWGEDKRELPGAAVPSHTAPRAAPADKSYKLDCLVKRCPEKFSPPQKFNRNPPLLEVKHLTQHQAQEGELQA